MKTFHVIGASVHGFSLNTFVSSPGIEHVENIWKAWARDKFSIPVAHIEIIYEVPQTENGGCFGWENMKQKRRL